MDPDCASEEGKAIIQEELPASRGQFFSISLDSVVRAGAKPRLYWVTSCFHDILRGRAAMQANSQQLCTCHYY
jgi:hypothetical protein